MAKILLLEDDTALAQSVVEFLQLKGQHVVDWTPDGQKADELLRFYQYELLILDWDVPKKSGLELLLELRDRGRTVSVLFLTSKSAVSDRMQGLDSGADDYLCKPFSLDELGARVRALLRRGSEHKTPQLRAGDIVIDVAAHIVKKSGELVHLTGSEFALLEFLVRNKGKVFSPEALLNRVWASDSDTSPDMVKATVMRIRRKLGENADESVIRSVFGEGYRVDSD
jgi:DNA-binding response OmpR family regulator